MKDRGTGDEGDRPPAEPGLPFPDSLCHRCGHLRLVHSGRHSVFLRCTHPELPKYRPQPVPACDYFAPAPGEEG